MRIDEIIKTENDDDAPVLSSWKYLYYIVLLNLIILISLFYFFTKYFE